MTLIQFNTYGELPNHELFRRYGFIDMPNIFSNIEIRAELLLDLYADKNIDDKVEFLLDQDILQESSLSLHRSFIIEADGVISPEILYCLLVLEAEKDEFENIKKNVIPRVEKMESRWRKPILSMLLKRKSEFPAIHPPGFDIKKSIAFHILSEEYEILNKAMEVL